MSKGMQIKFNYKQTVSKIDFYGSINYISIYIFNYNIISNYKNN